LILAIKQVTALVVYLGAKVAIIAMFAKNIA
jgi:hypothetical protein